jgi:hypothetical protein
MHYTLEQALATVSSTAVLWLMVKLGSTRGMLSVRTPARCVSCGRRLGGRGCRCSDT